MLSGILISKAVCIEKGRIGESRLFMYLFVIRIASACKGRGYSLFKETQNILFQYFTFFIEEHRTFSSFLVCQNNLIGLTAILCRFHRCFLNG